MADIGLIDIPGTRDEPLRTADAARGKRSFYRHLIVAARFFADRARESEDRALRVANDVAAPELTAGAVAVRHRSYVTGSILSAAAFLEASINELYLELHGARSPERTGLPRRVLTVLGRFWSDIERAPILHRYQVVLMVADAERFDERRAPFQDVDSLIKLRDVLVHCGPERPESRRRLRTIEQRLHNRFAPNPLAAAGSTWFPDVCLSAECAEWAVQAADAFTQEFCRRMSLPARGLEMSEADIRRSSRSIVRDRGGVPHLAPAGSMEPNEVSPSAR